MGRRCLIPAARLRGHPSTMMKLPPPGNGVHSRNSNESLASDLAAFVREKQIGGRGFLRTTEADLDGYVPVFPSLSLSQFLFARS